MKVVPFKAGHIEALSLQEAQAYLGSWVSPALAKALEGEHAFTGITDDGRVLVCSGVVRLWSGRYHAWAYFDEQAGENMLAIHRAVKRFLDLFVAQRVEATVDCEFERGHRWIKMLGFELEAPRMRAYRPDGGDCSLYARVRT